MKLNDIHSKLLEYNTPDRLKLIRAEYKGTDEGFIHSVTEILNELEREHKFKVYERVNLLYMNEQDQQAQDYERLNMPNLFIDTLRFELENFAPTIKEEIPAAIEKEYNREHLDIFKPKGFELWDSLYKEFDVKRRNSKDLNFMYSQMKADGYISSIVTLSNMELWLDTWYKLNDSYRLRDYLLDLKNNPTIKRFTIYNQIKSNM